MEKLFEDFALVNNDSFTDDQNGKRGGQRGQNGSIKQRGQNSAPNRVAGKLTKTKTQDGMQLCRRSLYKVRQIKYHLKYFRVCSEDEKKALLYICAKDLVRMVRLNRPLNKFLKSLQKKQKVTKTCCREILPCSLAAAKNEFTLAVARACSVVISRWDDGIDGSIAPLCISVALVSKIIERM